MNSLSIGPIAGVLLAGGQSRRMGGGDKCLRELAGRPILTHIIERAAPQADALVINANGDSARFASFDLPVVSDSIEGFAGPLAGVLAGLDWARAQDSGFRWVASFATDAPFFPDDLVERLAAEVEEGADMACAASGGRRHPVFGLWPVAHADDLRAALTGRGVRKVDDWTAGFNRREVEFATGAIDPFFNVNRPEDLQAASSSLVN